jgi:hypothetical protein
MTAAFWPTKLASLGIIPPTEVNQKLVLRLGCFDSGIIIYHAFDGQLNCFTQPRALLVLHDRGLQIIDGVASCIQCDSYLTVKRLLTTLVLLLR